MEDYVQFSAKTKSEAITKACIELGTSSDQLDIQVVSEGSSGFLASAVSLQLLKYVRSKPFLMRKRSRKSLIL